MPLNQQIFSVNMMSNGVGWIIFKSEVQLLNLRDNKQLSKERWK